MIIPTMMITIDRGDDNDDDPNDEENHDDRNDHNDDDHDDDNDGNSDDDNNDDNDDDNDVDDYHAADDDDNHDGNGDGATCKRVPAHRPFSQQLSSPHQPEATSPKLQIPRPHLRFRPLCSYCFCCPAAQMKFQVFLFLGGLVP